MESDAKKVGHKVTHLINKNLIDSKLILIFLWISLDRFVERLTKESILNQPGYPKLVAN